MLLVFLDAVCENGPAQNVMANDHNSREHLRLANGNATGRQCKDCGLDPLREKAAGIANHDAANLLAPSLHPC